MIAAVFVNRLRKNMMLQTDPTIIYGLTRGRPLGRGILLSELQRQTPYNTYFIDGLPPTPIANPGRAAIAAVLNPPETGDLYFVADGTEGTSSPAPMPSTRPMSPSGVRSNAAARPRRRPSRRSRR